MKVRTATGLIVAYMRACKFDGWASFWHAIYVLPGFEHDQRLPTLVAQQALVDYCRFR